MDSSARGGHMSSIIWYPGHELLLHDIVRAENCHLYDARGNRYLDNEMISLTNSLHSSIRQS